MNTHRRHPRRGFTIVPVLVCFVLIGLVVAGLLRLGLTARRQSASAETRLQAEWLAESGLERARARLAAEPDYHGETWELSAEALDAPAPGVVTITVAAPDGQPDRRRIDVQADYPKGGDQRARQSRHVVVDAAPAPKEKEKDKEKEGATP